MRIILVYILSVSYTVAYILFREMNYLVIAIICFLTACILEEMKTLKKR